MIKTNNNLRLSMAIDFEGIYKSSIYLIFFYIIYLSWPGIEIFYISTNAYFQILKMFPLIFTYFGGNIFKV